MKYTGIANNSRMVKKGGLFVAIKGEKVDGHDFIEDAVARGASACVVQEDIWRKKGKKIYGAKIIRVPDTHLALAEFAASFYGEPSKKLKMTGITGTNGKTTISFLLDKILTDLGYTTGILGTVVYKIGRKIVPADRTTPDALSLQGLLHEMVKAHTDHAVMEVSSHALDQKRVGSVSFDQAVFTNLTPEHLDYHKTMRDYFMAKAKLFGQIKRNGCACINNDDPYAPALIKQVKARTLTFGIKNKADIYPIDIHSDMNGSRFVAVFPDKCIMIKTHLIGMHNISNILAALAVCYAGKLKLEHAALSVARFKQPPGRLEAVEAGQDFKVFVDYAHTSDALKNVLSALRPYVKRTKLITVFGCGGDRDRTKRPKMGSVVTRLSDHAVITSDNPRSEDPDDIIDQIKKGISRSRKNYSVIPDRRLAIMSALKKARKGDIVLIAGKGHETEQIVGDKRYKFDDRVVARNILKGL